MLEISLSSSSEPGLFTSLPYLARLRQCLIDHYLPSNDNRRNLYNAMKYATSFPVIFLSAAQRIVDSELTKTKDENAAKALRNEHPLFRLWLVQEMHLYLCLLMLFPRLLAVAVNSLYSFWWDVTNDWGLDLLRTPSLMRGRQWISQRTLTLQNSATISNGETCRTQNKPYPPGLRPTLLYPLSVYPLVIFLNLILRMTWSIKLSSHLHSRSDGGELIFWLEVAELVRRWMWVFVRVEWEVVRKMRKISEEEEYELIDSDQHDG
jgi:hypothetical protein